VAVLGVVTFVYFVFFPHDLAAILAPLEKILAVSSAVSPWLYGVIAVGILSWTALRIWGGNSTHARNPDFQIPDR
jgi:hypothetical protein